jgi:2-keto-4-pentenoate hydratase
VGELIQDPARALVTLLAQLRRERRQRSGLDAALVPPDADAAYRIAARVEAELGWRRLGWKIAATRPEMQRALRATSPIYGRVYEPFLLASPAAMDFAPLLHPLPECEYVVRLAHDLPPRARAYSEAEVREAVAAVSPGIEVAECRFVPDAAFPPLAAILADGAGSGTLVLGAPIEGWAARDIPGQQIVLRVDGVERRRGTAREALGHPLEPLTWLANELSRTSIGLRAGEVVSTGTCTGMLKARAGEEHVADYGPFGEVRVRFA